jgi:hypothetical protein
MSAEVSLLSRSFPFRPTAAIPTPFDLVRSHLPTYERSLVLCNSYLQKAGWLFNVISQAQLVDEMLPAIYRKTAPYPPDDYSGAHDLSLFYSALSVGALLELENPNGPADAEHFQELSRASMNLQNVLEKPTLASIQSLHLQSIYYQMTGQSPSGEATMETAWSVQCLGAQLAYSVGRLRLSTATDRCSRHLDRSAYVSYHLYFHLPVV